MRLAALALVHVALISSVPHRDMPPAALDQTAHMLTGYAHRYVRRWWHRDATVRYLPGTTAQQARAAGYWPLEIVPMPHVNYGGVHKAGARGPYALVFYEGQQWTEALASHELAEMLVDPDGRGHEVCDPVEYHFRKIDGLWASDMVTPAFYNGGRGPRDIFGYLR